VTTSDSSPTSRGTDSTTRPSPHPGGPAPVVRRILTQARLETRILLSNGEQLMVAILMPALVLCALRFLPVGRVPGLSPIDTAVAATAATALISTAFTSQAIQSGFDRRGGVLRWVATTPLGRDGYLAGKILATLAVHVVQIIVLGILALALGWRPGALGLLATLPVWLLGTLTFGALGLLVAGTLRTEAVLAVSNVLFLLFVTVGGVAVPAVTFPRFARAVVDLLPSGALGELLRAALAGGSFSVGSLLVLIVWAILAPLGVLRWFRWTSV
jgi:ABC-2 type transport system permease protein